MTVSKTVHYEDSFCTDATEEEEVAGDYASWLYNLQQEEDKGSAWFEGTVRINARSMEEAAEMLEAAANSVRTIVEK